MNQVRDHAGRSPEADLSVSVGALRFRNPVLCASGTFGYGIEEPALTEAAELGAIVTKTVTLEPRSGNPPPRLWETPAGMLNSIGLQNVGVDRFISEKLPALRALGVPIVVSIGGRRAEEYAETARRIEAAGAAAALEVNISCPNVREGGLEFCQDLSAAARVVSGVRQSTRLPVWAKLSPNVTSIGSLARACVEAGADALVAVNTFVGMAVDVRTRRSRLSANRGGLSGPAIRALALAKVWETVRAVEVPVIGVGGIGSAEDALEFLLVGAGAVQVGTAGFLHPAAGAEVVRGLREFLRRERVGSVRELIGTYREGS